VLLWLKMVDACQEELGQGTAEYVFILALVALAVVVSFSALGGGVTTLISGVRINTP